MTLRVKILSLLYLAVTSLTVLVMLVNSFEQFDKKYLPSFMLAQKFALPIIVASLAFIYFVFFEPERMERRSNVRIMRVVMIITTGLFAYFLSSVNMKVTSEASIIIYAVQLAVTVVTMVYFFLLRPKF
ncbi:MAG: hypothetical protein ACYC09_04110 [Bacteroidota bacterium]